MFLQGCFSPEYRVTNVTQVQKAWIKGRDSTGNCSGQCPTRHSSVLARSGTPGLRARLIAMVATGQVTWSWTILTRASHDRHEPMARCILEENSKDIGIYYTHVMRSGVMYNE